MKYILALLLLSCTTIPAQDKPTVVTYQDKVWDIPDDSFQVIVFDSCEYVVISQKGGPAITHKGNCSNQKHCKN